MNGVEQPFLTFRMDAYPVDRDLIAAQANFSKAMELALSFCRFENDKQAAAKLDIDSGLFSRRKSGQAPWQVDDVRKVMDRGQTLIPLAWLAHQYGHGLVMLETEAERQNRELRERITLLEHDKRVLTEALHGRPA